MYLGEDAPATLLFRQSSILLPAQAFLSIPEAGPPPFPFGKIRFPAKERHYFVHSEAHLRAGASVSTYACAVAALRGWFVACLLCRGECISVHALVHAAVTAP